MSSLSFCTRWLQLALMLSSLMSVVLLAWPAGPLMTACNQTYADTFWGGAPFSREALRQHRSTIASAPSSARQRSAFAEPGAGGACTSWVGS